MSDVIKDEIDAFFAQGEREVDEFLDRLGKTAVEFDKTNGNYRNRTGNLRRSNYSNVHNTSSFFAAWISSKLFSS